MASTPVEPDAGAGYLSGAAVDPSIPYTAYGNTAPVMWPSPSSSPSAFSPSQAPPASVDRRLLSGGFHVLQLPSGGNNPEPPAEALIPWPPMAFPARRLDRSSSDPVPLSQFQNSGPSYAVGSRTDPNSPSGSLGTASHQSPAQELPSPKRLKRLDQIQRIKQMKQLFDEMVQEDEQDDGLNNVSTEKAIGEAEEDVVSAKKDGDTIRLKFKCSCGSGFDVILIGQCCDYKLV